MDLRVHPYTVITSVPVEVNFVKLWHEQEAKWYYGVYIEVQEDPDCTSALSISIF